MSRLHAYTSIPDAYWRKQPVGLFQNLPQEPWHTGKGAKLNCAIQLGKERCIKQINDIQEWQNKQQNSAVRQKMVMSQIYFLNPCTLCWEVNLFDFHVESIAFRIKILINVTLLS